MDRSAVEQWVSDYERLWRAPSADGLADLFTPDATYSVSPWAPPIEGLAAIAEFWGGDLDDADESFTMSSEVLAVDGDTAVVRVFVDYDPPKASRWRDLWVIEFSADGRCVSFEEWPFAPGQPDGH